jgi:Anaphase-promoting complex sub unit 1 C-terminal domain
MCHQALQTIRSSPSLYLTWQLKLLTSQVLSRTETNGSLPPLVSADLALSVQQHVSQTLDSWEQGKTHFSTTPVYHRNRPLVLRAEGLVLQLPYLIKVVDSSLKSKMNIGI